MRDPSQTADHAVMRGLNRAAVLDHLRATGVASRAGIAAATGLAKPTVSLIVADLLREDLVSEVGLGPSQDAGGRPPVLLRFNAMSSHLVGIHIGVRRTSIRIADALGDTLAELSFDTPRSRPRAALQRIAQATLAEINRIDIDPARLRCVVACLPGLVTVDGNLRLAPNLGWRDVPVADILSAEFGCEARAFNTTQATLVAEAHEGSAQSFQDVVLVYAGTGIGAAALASGQLITGAHGFAGEFGHVPWDPNGRPCKCGKRGCLETVASADAIVRDFLDARTSRRSTLRSVSAEDVAAAAAAGDTDATQALQAAGNTLGAATAWLVNLLDPECVVLAGGLAAAGPSFVDAFAHRVTAGALAESGLALSVRTAALGQAGEVSGAVLLARQQSRRDLRVVAS